VASPRRDWYLANLGIVRYLPLDEMGEEVALSGGEQLASGHIDENISARAELPGAESEAARRLKSELAISSADRVDVPQQTQDKPERVSAVEAQALQKTLKPAATDRQGSVLDVPGQQTSELASELASEEPFECRLGFWQASDRLVVLSAMPPGQRPTAGQITMLTNLLKAIKCLDNSLPPVDLIDWPQTAAIGLQGMARNLQGARDFVSVFLQAKARLQPFTHALLMGELAALVATDSHSVEAGQQFDLHCGAKGIVTRSLHEMEHDPGLKGETWQAIKFLASH